MVFSFHTGGVLRQDAQTFYDKAVGASEADWYNQVFLTLSSLLEDWAWRDKNEAASFTRQF